MSKSPKCWYPRKVLSQGILKWNIKALALTVKNLLARLKFQTDFQNDGQDNKNIISEWWTDLHRWFCLPFIPQIHWAVSWRPSKHTPVSIRPQTVVCRVILLLPATHAVMVTQKHMTVRSDTTMDFIVTFHYPTQVSPCSTILAYQVFVRRSHCRRYAS